MIQNEIVRIIKLVEEEFLKTNFGKVVTLHSQAVDIYKKYELDFPDPKKIMGVLQIGIPIHVSKEFFWVQTFILKAFEEKAVDKISYLIESLEQSIRSPKNSDALQHVPIQLVEQFKEDIEG